jgi:hypothetical protein
MTELPSHFRGRSTALSGFKSSEEGLHGRAPRRLKQSLFTQRREDHTSRKEERRDLHAAINELTREVVAKIVRKNYPRTNEARVDALAKRIVAAAHRKVSPRP